MSVGISRTLAFLDHTEAVSVDAYGTKADGPGPEVIGRALGMIFAAGEAALAVDPYGDPSVSIGPNSPHDGMTKRLTVRLLFKVSSDDVLAGGPIHNERITEVGRAMYRALEERF